MKVVILGKGKMLYNIILGAIESEATIAGIFPYDYTVKNKLEIFFHNLIFPTTILNLIHKYKIPIIKFKSANDNKFKDFLIKQNIDLVIIGTWKEKIKKEIFETPKIATINIHPSLLPKYRGPNPYLQTILHGEKESGITIHLLDNNYDTGPILLQKKIPIFDIDTSKELRERTVSQVKYLVTKVIKEISTGQLIPKTQDRSSATYYKNITGNEKMLNFAEQTTDEIYKTVKALHPFLPCYITIGNEFLIVNPYHITIQNDLLDSEPNTIIDKDIQKESLTIVCKDKRAIKFDKLKYYKIPLFTKIYLKFLKLNKL